MEPKPHVEILSNTEIRIGEKTYKFRDPAEWTLGEVTKIEDESTVFVNGMPEIRSALLRTKTVAAATGLSEKEAAALPYDVGHWLYMICRWQPVPLGDLRTLNSEPEEEQSPNGA